MASLDDIYHIISLRISIHDFMKDVKDDSIRFIGIDATNQAHGISMDRPVTKIYECLPDAPALPHPSSGKEPIRQKYYLPLKAREFVKIKLTGRDALLVLPKWLFDAIPGTKCFRLVEQPPIIKYVDSRIQRGEAWDEQLHAHCEQAEPTPVFELVPLSLEELNEMFGKELGRPQFIPEVKEPDVPIALARPLKPIEELNEIDRKGPRKRVDAPFIRDEAFRVRAPFIRKEILSQPEKPLYRQGEVREPPKSVKSNWLHNVDKGTVDISEFDPIPKSVKPIPTSNKSSWLDEFMVEKKRGGKTNKKKRNKKNRKSRKNKH